MSEPASAAPQRRFTAALGAAVVLCVCFGLLLGSSLSPATREGISTGGFVLGGVAIIVTGFLAFRRSPGPGRRRAWALFTVAASVAVVGNAWVAALGIDSVADPSAVSLSTIAIALVLSIVGMLRLADVRKRGPELVLLVLDGLVMGGAVLLVTSIVVYSEVLDSPVVGMGARVSFLLFPLLDVVLATVALLLIVRSHGNRTFFCLIGVGFLLYAISDLTFAVKAAQDDFAFGTLIDLGWIAGYLLLAASALHPDATVDPKPEDGDGGSDVQGTIFVYSILLAAVAVQLLYPDQPAKLSLTQMVMWFVLVLAAGTRQVLLTGDNANLRHGLEQRVREQTADLRRMARQTEVLLDSVGDGIYGVDPDGRVTFINPSGAKALGFEPDALLGKRAHQEFHATRPDGTPYDWSGCYITEAIRRRVVVSAEEDTYVRPDGTSFPVEITSSPLLDEDRVRGAVVVFRDVTQRHEIDRMKNEFLSVVSHELRTPLTSIRGSLGLLASGALVELTPQAERMVSIAVESSDRLTRLINDILDMERIESGKLPMNLMPQEASTLLQASATELGALAATSGVRIELAPASGRVLADSDRIVQTLTNLLGNAIKFSPAGSSVRMEVTAGTNDMTFAVHDEGRGIPQDKLQTIFEPFEQVDSSDARQKGGTGLGLAISRGIIERHGGRIWAESAPGRGATVRFTLPRVSDSRYAGEDGSADAPVILVCDDDPATVLTLSAMLDAHGYRPVGATNGQEALERAEANRPAAVLLDMVMPGTSGAEVLTRLKALDRTRNIPVVVISGVSPSADPVLASTTEEWLVKPVSEERLIVAVAAALEGRRRDAHVLIVEDDQDLARVLAALLASHGLDVVHVATVADAVRRGRELRPQVIVLDLDLPDGDGTEVISELRREGHLAETAVVVYSATDAARERSPELDTGNTVFLTKARAGPEQLEDRVLKLMDAVTGKSMGGEFEGVPGVNA